MSHVLRIKRSDDPTAFVLVKTKQNGPSSLDLSLSGTDGQDPFVAAIKQSNVQTLRSSNYHGTSEEWISALSALLLQQHGVVATQGLEAAASVANNAITISIRKNIDGITQRLGALTLTLKEEEELPIFDWVGIAAQSADAMRSELVNLQSSLSFQQQTIDRLTAELDTLVIAKKAHEEDLLKKFAALLNSKKLKIRDQQRLLTRAKVNPKTASQVHEIRSGSSRRPAVSRTAKRKANDSSSDPETSDSETGARPDSNSKGSDGGQTEGETDSGSDEFDPAPNVSQASRKSTVDAAGRARSPDSHNDMTPTQGDVAALIPPPRRQLPFARKSERQHSSQMNKQSPAPTSPTSKPAPAPTQGRSDEEDTDDEL